MTINNAWQNFSKSSFFKRFCSKITQVRKLIGHAARLPERLSLKFQLSKEVELGTGLQPPAKKKRMINKKKQNMILVAIVPDLLQGDQAENHANSQYKPK